MPQITICALCYGDFPRLHERLLNSIATSLEKESKLSAVREVRIGLQKITDNTLELVDLFAARLSRIGVSVLRFKFYWFGAAAPKYPAMRTMLHGDEAVESELVVWFDDDSFLDPIANWWSTVVEFMTTGRGEHAAAAGEVRAIDVPREQQEFIRCQDWYNPAAGASTTIVFVQGGLQILRVAALRKLDWPWYQLRHCGGDMLLGEALRHQGLRISRYSAGIHTNADAEGNSDKSQRRGLTEPPLGFALSNRSIKNVPGLPHYDMRYNVSKYINDQFV